MIRADIIAAVGREYLVSNIENDEFSYPKAFRAASLIFVPIQNAVGRTYEKLDIRFVKDNISVLIETKQNFASNLEEAKRQLSAYVEYEKALTGNKVVAILANTTNDVIMVWRGVISDGDFVAGYNEALNCYNGLFIATILCQERPKYSFGRKWKTHLRDTVIKLPQNEDGTPNWLFMEQYVKTLKYKPVSTFIKGGKNTFDITKWKPFKVKDIFDVKYGINMELNACIIADENDRDAINFVARTEENNGISAKVKLVEGKTPQPAGTITCAGGGSVLSTFLQPEPFYSGRDLYLLIPKTEMSDYTKLFCITILKANKYRYSYGRQANITLPHLELMLPVDEDGNPDYLFMESYIKDLPYGDRI